MSNHQPGFIITAAGEAYLKCHPFTDSPRCGACHRSQGDCFRSPCPTRLDACQGGAA